MNMNFYSVKFRGPGRLGYTFYIDLKASFDYDPFL